LKFKKKKYRIVYRGVPRLYRIVAFAVAVILVLGIFLYTEHIRRQLSVYNRRTLNAYARLWSLATTKSVGAQELSIVFEEIIEKSDFPMVLTTVDGEPVLWRNLDFEPGDTSRATRQRLKEIASDMGRSEPPVPIFVGTTTRALGYIYYGESPFVKWLRFVPLAEFILVVAMLILAYAGYNRLRYYEKQNIWLGMARETAHQLGTPISGLLGWIELLRDEIEKAESARAFQNAKQNPVELVDKMTEDIENLNRIVVRFGQVGSVPELEPTQLPDLLKQVVSYLRERTPRLLARVDFVEQFDPVPEVFANKLLLSWAVENLIKNSLEALPEKGGQIKVATRLDVEGENVQIIIADNGRGISSRNTRKIFSPGYTTKKRGWGLGLSLTKRIIEEYHFGKLFLLESKPFEKTTFVISFPLSSKTTYK